MLNSEIRLEIMNQNGKLFQNRFILREYNAFSIIYKYKRFS